MYMLKPAIVVTKKTYGGTGATMYLNFLTFYTSLRPVENIPVHTWPYKTLDG